MFLVLLLLLLAQESQDADRLQAAQRLMDSGRCAEAIPVLRELVAAHPQAPTLQYGLGRCYFEVEDFRQATATLKGVARLLPESAEVRFYLASAEGLDGDLPGGIEQLRAAMKINPRFEPAFRAFGMFRVQSGAFSQETIDALETAMRLDPTDARACYWTGKYYQVQGDMERAREFYEKSYKIDPDDPPTRLAMGQVLLADGDDEAAIGLFDSVLKIQPGMVPALLGRGRVLDHQGKAREALEAAEAAQRGALTFEDRSGAEWLLQHVYRELGREDDARAAGERLTRVQAGLDSDVVRLRELTERANRYEAEGRPERVAETMEAFLKIRETSGALVTLGDAYVALRRNRDAERCYVRAGQVGPVTDTLRERLRRVREAQGREEKK